MNKRKITLQKGSDQINVDERRKEHYIKLGYKIPAPVVPKKPRGGTTATQ